MNVYEYIEKITDGATINEISERAGIVKSTLWRQIKNNTVSYENLIKIARSYGVNPITALVWVGAVTPQEALQGKMAGDLNDASETMLIEEVARRLHRNAIDADRPIVLNDFELAANDDNYRDAEGTTAEG